MSNFSSYSFVFSLTFLVVAVCSYDTPSAPAINCEILRNCAVSINEPVNAATVGQNNCLVFRNECYFQEAYCKRQRSKEPLIRQITREQCKASISCNSACLAVHQPVCAEFLDKPRTFSNSCYLNIHSCSSNEGWVYLRDGEC